MLFIRRNVVNLCISYELDTWSRELSTDFTLGNCLLEWLSYIKTLILINKDTIVMVLDLMHIHNFRCQTVAGVKTLLFLVLIRAHLSTLKVKKKYFSSKRRSKARIR